MNKHCDWVSLFCSILICSNHFCSFSLVPDDVFAPNYIWKGSYNYRGRKQPMTLSITSFNSTTGRVNVSLSNSNMDLLLSGRFFLFVFFMDNYSYVYQLPNYVVRTCDFTGHVILYAMNTLQYIMMLYWSLGIALNKHWAAVFQIWFLLFPSQISIKAAQCV